MKKNPVASLLVIGTAVLGMSTAMAHEGHHNTKAAPAATSVSKTLEVTDCWIRLLPAPAPSAGYFKVKNSGNKVVQLTGAQASDFGMIMLHQTTHTDGMSRMSMADNVQIPAGEALEFKPGGYHAMLEDAADSVKVGSMIDVDFMFDTGEKTVTTCEVKPANTLPGQHH